MFLGHFALAFGAKNAAPAVSLGALFLACQFADLLWPVLLLLGVEEVQIYPGATAMTPLDFVRYPYSHSLSALVGWGILVGGTYTAATRSRMLAGVILGLLVVELLMFAGGIALYRRATMARDRIGSVGLWSLVAFLGFVYFASAFGPPPPDARTVAWSAMAMWLLVLWGYWVDGHRFAARSFRGRR